MFQCVLLLWFVSVLYAFTIYEDPSNSVAPYSAKITNVTNVFIHPTSGKYSCLRVTQFTLSPENAFLTCKDMFIEIITPFNITSAIGTVHDQYFTGFLTPSGGFLQEKQTASENCRKIKR